MANLTTATWPPAQLDPPAARPDLTIPSHQQAVINALNSHRGEHNLSLGIAFVAAEPGRLTATMPVDGNRQPFGLLHGGASAAFAETLGSCLANLAAPEGTVPVGVDLNATHHRSAQSGLVTGVCTPIHEGRSTATYQVEISNEAGKRVCTARLTCQFVAAQR
jgi:1,4-dihydroxy-2-naphthoyl-CoA hydrolase